jgi:hypothetical protein
VLASAYGQEENCLNKSIFGADCGVIHSPLFVMGRDPVEYAKRAKYQPPAMRVRGVCYTKKSPFRYNFGCSSLNYNEGKGDFNGQ